MNLSAHSLRLLSVACVLAAIPALRPLPAVADDAVVCVSQSLRFEVAGDGRKVNLKVMERSAINQLGRSSDELRDLMVANSFPYEPHKTRVRVWNGNDLRLHYDQNAFDDIGVGGDSFITDSRALALRIDPFQVGDTLEVSYELRIHPFLGFAPFTFEALDGNRTLELTYEVDIPASLEPRYREWNGLGEPETERHGDRVRWTWTVRDLDPYEQEALGPPPEDLLPTVSIGVNRIAWGPADTWEHLGQTYWEKARERVKTVSTEGLPVRGATDASALGLALERVQNNVRYVSIKLQEGRWIPHAAPETLRRKYGDCTDMSTLLLSVLNGEQQAASLALVATRGATGFKVDPLPTVMAFDHMVVCAGTDSTNPIWLDATDTFGTERNPRWDIQGAPALVVTGPHAGFQRIAVNTPACNRTTQTLRLRGSLNGHWTAFCRVSWTGSPAQLIRHMLAGDAKPVELARRLVEQFRYKPAARLSEDGIHVVETAPDTVSLELSFPVEPPLGPTGRSFTPGWERDPFPLDLFADAGRKTDVYWPTVGIWTDSLIVEPAGKVPSFLPDSTWTVEAGDLVCTLSQRSTPHSVCLVRTFRIGSLVYPVTDWDAGREARRRILRWSTRNLSGES